MFDDLKVSDWWFLGIAVFVGYLTVKHFMNKLPVNQPNDEAGAQAGPEVPHKEDPPTSDAAARSAGSGTTSKTN